jgi:two-component system phosphate regulon sensor histidine kinase PhoR
MSLSLRWRISITFSILIISAIGIVGIILSNLFYDSYLGIVRSRLTNETNVVAKLVAPDFLEDAPYPSLAFFADTHASLLDARITFIRMDGLVLIDTSIDPGELENHLTRPEVQAALHGNASSIVRYSTSLKQSMLYTASPVYQNNQMIGIVRLAISIQQIEDNIKVVRQTIILTAILTMIIAIILAFFLSANATRPLTQLTQKVLQIGSGERKPEQDSRRTDEIGHLDRAFSQMANQVNNQIDQLQLERSKLASVLSNMTDGLILIDSEGKVQLINRTAQRLFNISEQKAIGRPLIEVVRHHQLVTLWQDCISTGEQQTIMLETIQDRLFIQGFAIPLIQPATGNSLLVFQDLTRLRRLETVRRDFVSNVSHELRTPLASLKALVDTLLEGAMDDPPAARRFMSLMQNEIDTLTQMVQELLELSRIESGKVPLEKLSISPCELIHLAVERMQVQAERAGQQIHVFCDDNLPNVIADPKRITQVLINLIHNSIKFTPSGGKISLEARKQESRIIISVADTGIGIAPEELPRIFERFYKADPSRSGGGTGLGLSIARHIIEMHGGRIWAESTLGSGSTVFFILNTLE